MLNLKRRGAAIGNGTGSTSTANIRFNVNKKTQNGSLKRQKSEKKKSDEQESDDSEDSNAAEDSDSISDDGVPIPLPPSSDEEESRVNKKDTVTTSLSIKFEQNEDFTLSSTSSSKFQVLSDDIHIKSMTEKMKCEQNLLRSFLKLDFTLGIDNLSENNSKDQQQDQSLNTFSLSIETLIKASLPTKMYVGKITSTMIEFVEKKDTEQKERDKILKQAGEELLLQGKGGPGQGSLFFAGAGEESVTSVMNVFGAKHALKTPSLEVYPKIDNILKFNGVNMKEILRNSEEVPDGSESVVKDNIASENFIPLYLLTDCESKVYLTLGTMKINEIPENLRLLGRVCSSCSTSNGSTSNGSTSINSQTSTTGLIKLLLMEKTGIAYPNSGLSDVLVEINLDHERLTYESEIDLKKEMAVKMQKEYGLSEMVAMDSVKFLGKDQVVQVLGAFDQVLKRISETTTDLTDKSKFDLPCFFPTFTYKGADFKSGCVFKSGVLGLGYYEDVVKKIVYQENVLIKEEDKVMFREWVRKKISEGGLDLNSNGLKSDGEISNFVSKNDAAKNNLAGTNVSYFSFPLLLTNEQFQASVTELGYFSSLPLLTNYNNGSNINEPEGEKGTTTVTFSVDSLEFWLQNRELEASWLRSMEFTKYRSARAKSLAKELMEVINVMREERKNLVKDGNISPDKREEELIGTLDWNIARAETMKRISEKFG